MCVLVNSKHVDNWRIGELIIIYCLIILQVSPKKLKKYEKEFLAMKEAQLQQEDPVERLEVRKR